MTDLTNWYRQCHLKRGAERQVAWLPEKYARLGVVKLRDEDGWEVVAVMPTRQPYSQIKARERVTLPSIDVTP